MLPRETCWLLWMLYLTTIYLSQTGGQDCRYIFNNSLLTTVSPGIFGTPGFGSRKYPVGRRCHYIFIGKPDERVEMKFTKFNVQGVAPLHLQRERHSNAFQLEAINGTYTKDNLKQNPLTNTETITMIDFSDIMQP
ncbi:Hypothetical predicted protein [Mytilus galloprovincialis]|nr:Hypothetical predicted protein [Mytilus galloprovincialis]